MMETKIKKRRKDVVFYTERTLSETISYTDDPYDNAPEFHYEWEHKSGKKGANIIYGVSEKQGRSLINWWNLKGEGIWKYSEL